MKLIVEGFPYQSEEAQKLIGLLKTKDLDKSNSTNYVGYCYSKSLQDCVFFVPKVICDASNQILSRHSPEECIDFATSTLSPEEKSFLQGLNVWIYRAIKKFAEKEKSETLHRHCFTNNDPNGQPVDETFLDNILALKNFYEENRDFFIFTMKSAHSQKHKISWRKTVSRSTAIIQNETPIYLNPISKKKTIDWDEELMSIFFSILFYINSFGFEIHTNDYYELIKGESFKAYLNGLGASRLRQIKHRYYSDKTRKMWSLCYAFFEKVDFLSSSKSDIDFLVVNKFHVAFEQMVDDLIGQRNLDEMRKLGDGKIIDHIYQDSSLLSADDIFYLGDSKYYKIGSSVSETSKSTFKQFTYARNIVHESIKDCPFDKTWPFRDPLTEGYCITPNFFISAEIDPSCRYDLDGFENNSVDSPYCSTQFENRLFDRDTLWVNRYNLNFLYLLSTYASADSGIKRSFREKARRFFRDSTIDLMNDKYEFWELSPKSGKLDTALPDSIKWRLRGMIYRLGKHGQTLLFAIEKPQGKNKQKSIDKFSLEYQPIIDQYFNHKRCILSKNSNETITYIDTKASASHGFFFFFFDDESDS